MNGPIWLAELRERVRIEFDKRPPVATLATVDEGNFPRARTIICRAFRDDGAVWITSDARSRKNREIRIHPSGDLVIYLDKAREQYRLAGGLLASSNGEARQQAWNELSDATRSMFFWDEPGAAVRSDFVAPEIADATKSIPATFDLLILAPDRVEHLDLKSRPSARRQWLRQQAWCETCINP